VRQNALRGESRRPEIFVPTLFLVQFLRGLAALSVAMLHAQHEAAALALSLGSPWEPGFHFPWPAGVDVFFVISGVIMVHASRGSFGEEGAPSLFLARRVARIVPLYWAATTLYLLLALVAPGLLTSEILEPWPVLASYLFIPFERPDGIVQPLYSLGWTLNYEMFFYALFGLALALPYRRAIPVLVAALLALVALGRAVHLPEPLGFWTSPFLLEFVFGLALGHLRVRGVALGRNAQGMLVLAGLALLTLDLTRTEGMLAARPLAWGLPATLLVAAAALGRTELSPRTAATRFAVALGDASYALYLLHPFAIRGCRAAVAESGFGANLGPVGFIALSLVLAIAVSLVVHRLFERPATEWVRRRLSPPRAGLRRAAPES
jgi:peptidoglycan/LPS O-acetylase OafA/YrhL